MRVEDLLPGNISLESLAPEVQKNLKDLCVKMNALLLDFDGVKKVTSGYRTLKHHLEIYRGINERRQKEGLRPVSAPLHSRHLEGLAVDLADLRSELARYLLDRLELAEDLGLYFEAFDKTHDSKGNGWCHCQTVPPKSGLRFFDP